ncbi:MAG: S8 family serine peptidase, partial [Erysipelotrichaceae bacterium]|nr:S8 family serine peptidase [Erysipelotrichaceae bacterium]
MVNSIFTVHAGTSAIDGNSGKGTKTAVELQDVDPNNYRSPRGGYQAANRDAEKIDEANHIFTEDETVRVSIVLNSPSTAEKGYDLKNIAQNKKAVSYRQSLVREQASIEKKIEKKLGKEIDVIWNVTLIGNLISAEVAYGDIETIKTVSGVKDVVIENLYTVPNEETPDTAFTTEYMIFAMDVWAAGYTGAGSLVAIIDTGINHKHELFDPEAFAYSLSQKEESVDLLTTADINAVLNQLHAKDRMPSATATGLYKNEKIPFAFNYLNGSYNTDHQSASTSNHGSHVAGIAAGNYYVKKDGAYVPSIEAVKAVGVAPDAQLMAMQVFNSRGSTSDSDYMVAIEDAIILGADAINLSLGMGVPGFTYNYIWEDMLNSLQSTSSVVAMSAGNEGSYHSVSNNDVVPANYLYVEDISFAMGGTPGILQNSLSTASADNLGSSEKYVRINEDGYSKYSDGKDAQSNQSSIVGTNQTALTTLAGNTYDLVFIDGYGTEDDYASVDAAVDLDGKIVAVNRGSLNFTVKGNNALPYNPKAIFVINNDTDSIYMSLGGDNPYTGRQPMVLLNISAALYLYENAEFHITEDGVRYYTATVYISAENDKHDFVADYESAVPSSFSSWGIPGSLTMKPEITSPGGAINSADGTTTNGYAVYSGTSMAAPHTAGMAALLAEYVEKNDLAKYTNDNQRTIIQSLLMSTAYPMIDSDGCYYPIMQQGAGLADVAAAVTSKSFIMMDENATASYADGKIKAELGDDPDRTGNYKFSFDITNFSDEVAKYELYTDLFTQYLSTADGNTILMAPDTDYLDYDETYTYYRGYDVDKDGDTDYDDVQAILDYVTGILTAEDIDTAVADIDSDGDIDAYDARQLIWIIDYNIVTVAPGETLHIDVEIQLQANSFYEFYCENGFYIEGYTYLFPLDSQSDVVHSIPLIGFYGNWTDPSMYDKTVDDLVYDGKLAYNEDIN